MVVAYTHTHTHTRTHSVDFGAIDAILITNYHSMVRCFCWGGGVTGGCGDGGGGVVVSLLVSLFDQTSRVR